MLTIVLSAFSDIVLLSKYKNIMKFKGSAYNGCMKFQNGCIVSTYRNQLSVQSCSYSVSSFPSMVQSTSKYFSSTSDMSTDAVGRDFRPNRIILMRHGESTGNVDEGAYVHTADWRICLTSKGVKQAEEAGNKLKCLMGEDGRVFFYNSPYVRTKHTLEEMIKKIDCKNRIISVREEPRLSEQQFGNFQNVEQVLAAKRERQRFGRFYYRFPSGESGLDVYSRVSSFITTFVRDCHRYTQAGEDLGKLNAVIVTHGLSLRLFLMRWFQFSAEQFELTHNPDNAQFVILEKKVGVDGNKWYELAEESRQSLGLPASCGVPRNVILHSLQRK